jgi:hypothetical protein
MVIGIDGKRYSWTQPACETCFAGAVPGVTPMPLKNWMRGVEVCCMCGCSTTSGIYMRVDPRQVPHPTEEP